MRCAIGHGANDHRRDPGRRVRYGNPGVASELGVQSSLGFGDLTLFFHAKAT
jgi:hypothetical protein